MDLYRPAEETFAVGAPDDTVRLLAPFDRIVWDRRRFEILWGWAYRFEAYTPASRRKLGYYALPLLWGDRVVGWGNVAVANGSLRWDIGYVASHPPRGRKFRQALEEELTVSTIFSDSAPDATITRRPSSTTNRLDTCCQADSQIVPQELQDTDGGDWRRIRAERAVPEQTSRTPRSRAIVHSSSVHPPSGPTKHLGISPGVGARSEARRLTRRATDADGSTSIRRHAGMAVHRENPRTAAACESPAASRGATA